MNFATAGRFLKRKGCDAIVTDWPRPVREVGIVAGDEGGGKGFAPGEALISHLLVQRDRFNASLRFGNVLLSAVDKNRTCARSHISADETLPA